MRKLLSHLPAFAFYSFVVFTFAFGLFTIFGTPTTHAYVPPRPTVELVKVFECNVNNHYDSCSRELENRANDWLQKAQPGARIVNRTMTAMRAHVFLAIFYEVPEWRTPQPKPPAEAVR